MVEGGYTPVISNLSFTLVSNALALLMFAEPSKSVTAERIALIGNNYAGRVIINDSISQCFATVENW